MELKLIDNLITTGDVVAVALSGGSDSCALLHALIKLREKLNFTIKAINVEHGIRQDQSISDSLFCAKLCSQYGIELLQRSVDAPAFAKDKHLSLEEAARILRYEIFQDAISTGFANKVAVAHHADDSAETVLFNLFRGASLSGVKGISSKSQWLIRPLLNTKKEEVAQYVDYHNIEYVTDSTNFDDNYSRNYIRNKVIPLITEKFPSAIESISSFSDCAREDDEFLYSLALSSITLTSNTVVIPTNLKAPLLSRAVIIALKHLGIEKDYTKKHVEAIQNLCKLETGKQVDLIGGIVATKEYETIKVCAKKTVSSYEYAPVCEGEFFSDQFAVRIKKCTISEYNAVDKKRFNLINGDFERFATLYVSGENIPLTAKIRSIAEGDIFTSFSGHTKSLKAYLVDKKIPKSQRKNLLVIADGNEVYAIFGVEISQKCKLNKNSKTILKLTCEKRV